MLIITNPNYRLADQFFELAISESVLTVSQYDLNAGAFLATDPEDFDIANYTLVSSKQFAFTAMFKAKTVMGISLDVKNKLSDKVLDVTDLNTNSRDVEQVVNLVGLCPGPVIVVFFNETADQHIIICHEPVKTDEAYVLKPHMITGEFVVEHYPAMAPLYEIRNAKRELLFKLGPNDSLSYLEAQVDIVAKLVAFMADQMTPEQKAALTAAFPGYDTALAKMQAQSVLAIKSIDKCNQEFDITKASVRAAQTAYFAKKAQLGFE